VRPTLRGLATCYPLMHDDYQGTPLLPSPLACHEEKILFLPSQHVGVWAWGVSRRRRRRRGKWVRD